MIRYRLCAELMSMPTHWYDLRLFSGEDARNQVSANKLLPTVIDCLLEGLKES